MAEVDIYYHVHGVCAPAERHLSWLFYRQFSNLIQITAPISTSFS